MNARNLEQQIDALAKVLLDEFDGPDRDESACEMAVRVLREQRADNERLRKERYWLALECGRGTPREGDLWAKRWPSLETAHMEPTDAWLAAAKAAVEGSDHE